MNHIPPQLVGDLAASRGRDVAADLAAARQSTEQFVQILQFAGRWRRRHGRRVTTSLRPRLPAVVTGPPTTPDAA